MTPLDTLGVFIIGLLLTGIAATTAQTFALLVQLSPPKKFWILRGVLLIVFACTTIYATGAELPSAVARLQQNLPDAQHVTWDAIQRTGSYAGWVWCLYTVQFMLARGKLADRPSFRRGLIRAFPTLGRVWAWIFQGWRRR